MAEEITFNSHGKGRVRIVKVIRHKDGTHDVHQMNVQIQLEGDTMAEAFWTGSNAKVVPTDTCKNTVYCIGKLNNFESMEEFGVILCRHFLSEYPKLVNKITVEITKDAVWERLTTPDSKGVMAAHKHAFKRVGPKKPYTKVIGEKRSGVPLTMSVTSGFTGLDVLKTTQSGFEGFHTDRYTSLPEVSDRLVGTSVSAEWVYCPGRLSQLDFNQLHADIERALVSTFSGPADVGVYSASVQQTLQEMGVAALKVHPAIQKIILSMPNIHNIPFPLERYGITSADHTGKPDIFYPIDEPHGMIKAEIVRSKSARSKL